MSDFMRTIFFLSILGSVLSIIVFSINLMVKNKISKSWQYYIWLIVILRFLVPVFPKVNKVNYVKSDLPIQLISLTTSNYNISERKDAAIDNDNESNIISNIHIIESKTNYIEKLFDNIWILWTIGFIVSFGLNITFYIVFIRNIRKNNKRIENQYYFSVLEDCKKDLNIKREFWLSKNSHISTPMLVGIFRTKVLLPCEEYSMDELNYIYKHELTHYKKLDLIIRWIINFTVSIHWFNPIIYLVRNEINKVCELSCDEMVVRNLNKDQRKAYGNVLLKIAENKGRENDLFVPTMYRDKEILKERLSIIMKFQGITKKALVVPIILSIIVSTVAVVSGATFVEPNKGNDLKKNVNAYMESIIGDNIKYNELFALKDRFSYASIFKSNKYFEIEGNNRISLHLDFKCKSGEVGFYIYSDSNEIVYEKSGNNVNETIEIDLKDGNYRAVFEAEKASDVEYNIFANPIIAGSKELNSSKSIADDSITWIEASNYSQAKRIDDARMDDWWGYCINNRGPLIDNQLNTYTKAVRIDENAKSYKGYLSYNLDKKYDFLKGKIVVWQDSGSTGNIVLKIYGDKTLLYTSDTIKYNTKPLDINLDVSSYGELIFEVEKTGDKVGGIKVGFADMGLYTKK
ncbi:NPCBM/NEW2 domain-containing protein [Tissierella sp. MSJ-40]|uniref:NPCBM/NEW2 domain-containing protein n=1 Tax=Tissierella simiarum TaxID=2841534 RepID=A0ABS6E5A1_9FIRM|nr:M56 family metallopeptidase [Tissierella simiarum]MBU5438110.1 NPCBM/NEW2 domain-containing protein [Tissierella simiarum]